MQDGQTIHLTGSIPAGAKRYEKNLLSGINVWPFKTVCSLPVHPLKVKWYCRFFINLSLGSGTDTKVGIALHINPHWDDGKPVVVRNSYLKNKWGSEERWGDFFPLTAGQNFECIILVQSDCFKVNAAVELFFHALSRDPDEESLYIAIKVM